jgi:hypothetical protein
MALGGGQHFQPPRLMVGINRGGHFLLTKAVRKIVWQNWLTEAGKLIPINTY